MISHHWFIFGLNNGLVVNDDLFYWRIYTSLEHGEIRRVIVSYSGRDEHANEVRITVAFASINAADIVELLVEHGMYKRCTDHEG